MIIFLTLPSDITNFSLQCILLPPYPVLQWPYAWIISWSWRFWRILSDDLLSTDSSPVIYILHIACVNIVSYFWNSMHICIDSMHLFFCCRWCSHRINTVILSTLSDCKCSGNFKLISFKILRLFITYLKSQYVLKVSVYTIVSAKSFRPSAVGRENCRFLTRLMFFNYVHTASLMSALLLHWWRQYDRYWVINS